MDRFLALLAHITYFVCFWNLTTFVKYQASLKLYLTDIILLSSLTSFTHDCPGIPLIWDPEDPLSVFRNYPWTRHAHRDHMLGYQFPTANYEGEDIVGFDIRVMHCTGRPKNGGACSHCQKLNKKVDHLRQLSKQPPGRLNYQYQTHKQLVEGHHSKNKIITDLQLSVRPLIVLFIYM